MDAIVARKFLIYLFFVILGFFVCDRMISMAIQSIIRQSEIRFSKVYQSDMDVDILILGNSRAVNAFNAPELSNSLNRNVFNLAYNGMSMEISEALLKDYIEYNEPPKVLVLEITNLYVENGLLLELKPYLGLSNRLNDLMREEYFKIQTATQVSHLYRYNSELFLRVFFYLNKTDQHWVNSGEMNQEVADRLNRDEDEVHAVSPFITEGSGWESMLRMLSLCEEEQIDVRLIVSPYFPAFADGYEGYDVWESKLRAMLPPHAKFYSFLTSIPDYEAYADPVHLNRRGSLFFANQLVDSGVFTRN